MRCVEVFAGATTKEDLLDVIFNIDYSIDGLCDYFDFNCKHLVSQIWNIRRKKFIIVSQAFSRKSCISVSNRFYINTIDELMSIYGNALIFGIDENGSARSITDEEIEMISEWPATTFQLGSLDVGLQYFISGFSPSEMFFCNRFQLTYEREEEDKIYGGILL